MRCDEFDAALETGQAMISLSAAELLKMGAQLFPNGAAASRGRLLATLRWGRHAVVFSAAMAQHGSVRPTLPIS